MKRNKTGGRKKGTPNKAMREVKTFCASIIESPRYQRQLRERIRKGTLPPALEAMLWHYAYGVPKQTVAVEGKPWPMYALAPGLIPVMSPDEE
jgi:hypothetical protein